MCAGESPTWAVPWQPLQKVPVTELAHGGLCSGHRWWWELERLLNSCKHCCHHSDCKECCYLLCLHKNGMFSSEQRSLQTDMQLSAPHLCNISGNISCQWSQGRCSWYSDYAMICTAEESRLDSWQRQGFSSFLHNVQTSFGAHPASGPLGTRGSFAGSEALPTLFYVCSWYGTDVSTRTIWP